MYRDIIYKCVDTNVGYECCLAVAAEDPDHAITVEWEQGIRKLRDKGGLTNEILCYLSRLRQETLQSGRRFTDRNEMPELQWSGWSDYYQRNGKRQSMLEIGDESVLTLGT